MPQLSARNTTATRAPHRRFVEPVWPSPRQGDRAAGLYAGEPDVCRRSITEFLRIYAHVALFYALFEVYSLEGRGLRLVTLTALAALPIHYLLPYRWKQPFFIAASIGGLFWVFGAVVGSITVALTLGLVLLASLPIAWGWRAGLVALFGLGLALARAGVVGLPLPELVWPILGSICMFRIVIYLHETRGRTERERLDDVMSYFFLLPNFAFHLFPVVDYRTLRRSYFSSEIHETQRAGLRLMLRGVIHLLLWRVINECLMVNAADVRGVASLTRFIVFNYLLYLRVSGLFHLACGILHLFGYRLPETHHHYLLATGFTDYWRRINIYWKDFMVKLVFHPVAFRLKRWPRAAALSIATVCVFVVTWLAHAYQSFWLRGEWGFSAPDGLFWGILGVLVWVNVLNDARRGARPRGAAAVWSRDTFVRVLKIAGTFATIAVLWSLWCSPSVESWLELLRSGLGGWG